jgi:hypothetical protein
MIFSHGLTHKRLDAIIKKKRDTFHVREGDESSFSLKRDLLDWKKESP